MGKAFAGHAIETGSLYFINVQRLKYCHTELSNGYSRGKHWVIKFYFIYFSTTFNSIHKICASILEATSNRDYFKHLCLQLLLLRRLSFMVTVYFG